MSLDLTDNAPFSTSTVAITTDLTFLPGVVRASRSAGAQNYLETLQFLKRKRFELGLVNLEPGGGLILPPQPQTQ